MQVVLTLKKFFCTCKWRMIIHGCIDGYSIYLHYCDNNPADTVFSMFAEGERQHGLPDRVRGDWSGEFLRVATLQWSFITPIIKELKDYGGMFLPGALSSFTAFFNSCIS